jgi:hypothetical protein
MNLPITNFTCNQTSPTGASGVCQFYNLNNTLAVCNITGLNGLNSSSPMSMPQVTTMQMTTMQMTTMTTTPFVDPVLLSLITNIKPGMTIIKIAQLANDTMVRILMLIFI